MLYAQVFRRLDRLVALRRCQCCHLKLLRRVHQTVWHNNVAVAAGHPQLLPVRHLSGVARLQQGRRHDIGVRLAYLQVSVRRVLVLRRALLLRQEVILRLLVVGGRRVRQVQLVGSLASYRHFYLARLHHERAVLLQVFQR